MRKFVPWHSVVAIIDRFPFHANLGAQTPEKFNALVRRIEVEAHRYPRYYRTRLRLLAFLGYAYIFAVFGLLGAMLWGLHWLCLVWGMTSIVSIDFILVFIALAIIRLLWLDVPRPQGVPVTAADAPELFRAIAQYSRSLKAPACHHILLTDDLNAAVVQRPRFGLLGGQRNYLLLGLPLMQVLSPQQFRAVILHELRHLSGNDGRFSGWIHQMRQLWFDLAAGFETNQQGSWLFRHFFQWYAPFFKAYSFVLARANEYEADRTAARWAGVEAKAEALLQTHIYSQFLHTTVWPQLHNRAIAAAILPDQMVTTLLHALRRGPSLETARTTIELALMNITDTDDTHPCLGDRLRALDYTVDLNRLPSQPKETAAQYFLGRNLEHWLDQLDIDWVKQHQNSWMHRYRIRRRQLACLNRLTQKSTLEPLTLGELWQRAWLTQTLHYKTAAIPFFQSVLRRSPHHPQANYHLGKILVEQENWQGILHIERAMNHDPSLVIPGTELLYEVCQSRQQWHKADIYRQRRQQHQALWAIAHKERDHLRPSDPFHPHHLPLAECQQLSAYFHQCPEIQAVYLVKKVFVALDEPPRYVFGVIRSQRPGQTRNSWTDESFSQWLEAGLCFAADRKLVIFNPSSMALCKAIRQVDQAPLYVRQRSRLKEVGHLNSKKAPQMER
ncbi:MAG: M48 family metallopeptidase [Leptolyngbyaceae bacterium]|nr:M48 family metallopeptidase [Leptolyngbyaceae bacterium]